MAVSIVKHLLFTSFTCVITISSEILRVDPKTPIIVTGSQEYSVTFEKAGYYKLGDNGSDICKEGQITGLQPLSLTLNCSAPNDSVTEGTIDYTVVSTGQHWCRKCEEKVARCSESEQNLHCIAVNSEESCTFRTSLSSEELSQCASSQSCEIQFQPKEIWSPKNNSIFTQHCQDRKEEIWCWDLLLTVKYQCVHRNEVGGVTEATSPSMDTTTEMESNLPVIAVLIAAGVVVIGVLIAIIVICMWLRKRKANSKKKGITASTSFVEMAAEALSRNKNTYAANQEGSELSPLSTESHQDHQVLLKRDSMDYDEIEDNQDNNLSTTLNSSVRPHQGKSQFSLKPDVISDIRNEDVANLGDHTYQDYCPQQNILQQSPTSIQKHQPHSPRRNINPCNVSLPTVDISNTISVNDHHRHPGRGTLEVSRCNVPESLAGSDEYGKNQTKARKSGDQVQTAKDYSGSHVYNLESNLQPDISKSPNNALEINEECVLIDNAYYEGSDINQPESSKRGNSNANTTVSKGKPGPHIKTDPETTEDYSYVYNHFPLEGRLRSPPVQHSKTHPMDKDH